LGIDNKGDTCGQYNNATGTQMTGFIYSGGTFNSLSAPTNMSAGDGTSGEGLTAVAMNNNGQAVGYNQAAIVSTNYATVWTYSGSGAGFTSSGLALQTATGAGSLATAWANVYGSSNPLASSQALAVNDSGTVVVGGWTLAGTSSPEVDTGYFLYNMTSQQYTSLGSLMLWDPMGTTSSRCGGHEQAINDAGAVVGYTGIQGSTWQAAIWQNGTITNLNTEYASILPAGFVLNNATAIDNNGDIVGEGTYNGNTMQAFEIINSQPGDANGDGRVDINDLTIVLSNYGQAGAWSQGNFLIGDPIVDINDLTILLANYGYGTTASAGGAGIGAVPEPCALALLAAGLAGLACASRRWT
jgi:probable HAF family extracellular repeat protein